MTDLAAEVERLRERNRQLEARRQESYEQWQKWVEAHDKIRAELALERGVAATYKAQRDRLGTALAAVVAVSDSDSATIDTEVEVLEMARQVLAGIGEPTR